MIGPVDHVYYWTRDMDRAVAFYTEIVGFSLVHRSGAEWAELQAGPIRFALHGAVGEGEVPGSGTVVLRVEDLDAARAGLEGRGVAFDAFVGEVEGFARFATFRDPDGNPVQIIEYAR
jgi:catechol 2,3-dioxygenase-like lactoylglutathione lyase family enzyme